MIARMWRGRLRACDVAEYERYIAHTGLKDYRATPGNRGAQMLTRKDGDVAYVITLSYWEDIESIRSFAGADVTKARYYPEDARFLLEFPERVEHFDMTE
jgi:heme-degrading monooxygenase HmoA